MPYPKRCEDGIWRDIGGEVVILDEEGTQACFLNETAALIWTLADGTRPVEEIAELLCDRFEVSFEEAVSDVQEFDDQLEKAGLVELLDGPAVTTAK